MVKITSFLLASVALFAVSTQAQVSLEPLAKTTTDLALYNDFALADGDMNIMPYPAPHNSGSLNILRRRATTTAKKPKKPTAKLTKEEQTILDTHNKFRALHQAPPLTWNAKSADFGNNWIQACNFAHSRGPHGENLAAGYKDFKSAITAWYDEVKMYNYNQPGFTGATGHFTQVVWKSTKQVGCAKKFCKSKNWTIYICEYDAPGNIVSSDNAYFKKNVLPPKKK